MKYLILALALFASPVFGQVYEAEVCVWAQYAAGYSDEYGLAASYKKSGQWVFLAERTELINTMTSKESTDFAFQIMVDAINTQIEIQLRPVVTIEPDSGIERIQWLTAQLSFSSNQLVYSP